MTLFQSFARYVKKNNLEITKDSEEGISIVFRYNNLSFVYLYDSNSPHFFRLMLPRLADYNGVNDCELNRRSLEISAEYKIGKLIVINNSIWASFEQTILDTDADNSDFYDMGIRILEAIYQKLYEFVHAGQNE